MSLSTAIDLGRPVQGDVIDVILHDHTLFETLLRQLRDGSADRDAARRAFSALHVAHALAEERVVYPAFEKRSGIDADEVHHGIEEHAEGNEALVAVLELAGTDTQAFDDAVEELSNAVAHHLCEEELTILNPARANVPARTRADLGARFCELRNRLLDRDCGRLEHVRKLVDEAERAGLLSDDEE